MVLSLVLNQKHAVLHVHAAIKPNNSRFNNQNETVLGLETVKNNGLPFDL